jgi:hypothetical protein
MDAMPVPMPPIGGAGGGGVPGALNLPKSPVGGAPGPGASPMLSPGDGAGMEAHIEDQIRGVMPGLLAAAGKIKPGTTKFNALISAIKTLNGVFGKPSEIGSSNVPKPAPPIGNAPPMGMGGAPPGIPQGGMGGPPGAAPPPMGAMGAM